MENLEEVIKQKEQAYWERNQLVLALSKLYPAWLGRHEQSDEKWDREWMNIVFIEIPTKTTEWRRDGGGEITLCRKEQLSWHIHEDDFMQFSHLQYNHDKKWDGHTTEEKYKRLRNIRKKFLGLF